MPDGAETAPVPGAEKLQVGEWTVEPALNQLSAGGRTRSSSPRPWRCFAISPTGRGRS